MTHHYNRLAETFLKGGGGDWGRSQHMFLMRNKNKNSAECYVTPALHLYIKSGVKASV